jgi:hypothetical protein
MPKTEPRASSWFEKLVGRGSVIASSVYGNSGVGVHVLGRHPITGATHPDDLDTHNQLHSPVVKPSSRRAREPRRVSAIMSTASTPSVNGHLGCPDPPGVWQGRRDVTSALDAAWRTEHFYFGLHETIRSMAPW